jgi:hypothetical protein
VCAIRVSVSTFEFGIGHRSGCDPLPETGLHSSALFGVRDAVPPSQFLISSAGRFTIADMSRSADRKPASSAEMFQIGLEYYVAARGAWERTHFQVIGNLFHHGFEMMLKGVLVQSGRFTTKDMTDHRHDLPWFWTQTKSGVLQDWSRFDQFIDDLQRWDLIRFGDFPEGKPKHLVIDAIRAARALPTLPGHDEYRLCLEDADELFVFLFREMGYPEFAVRALIGAGREDYERENHYAIRWPHE